MPDDQPARTRMPHEKPRSPEEPEPERPEAPEAADPPFAIFVSEEHHLMRLFELPDGGIELRIGVQRGLVVRRFDRFQAMAINEALRQLETRRLDWREAARAAWLDATGPATGPATGR
jgi:hypothetical protein